MPMPEKPCWYRGEIFQSRTALAEKYGSTNKQVVRAIRSGSFHGLPIFCLAGGVGPKENVDNSPQKLIADILVSLTSARRSDLATCEAVTEVNFLGKPKRVTLALTVEDAA